MSHIQDNIDKVDTKTMILYNRALVTIGLSAFREGLVQKVTPMAINSTLFMIDWLSPLSTLELFLSVLSHTPIGLLPPSLPPS